MTEVCNFQPQPAVESADKNVYVTLGTAVQLHFPVVHVSFVSSAELRPLLIYVLKERRAVAKTSTSLQPAPTKRREPSRSCRWRYWWNNEDRRLPHKCVSTVYFNLARGSLQQMFHLLISSVDIRSAFAWLRNNWGFTEVWEWVWNTNGSHTVNFDTLAPRKHVADYRMALFWCFM